MTDRNLPTQKDEAGVRESQSPADQPSNESSTTDRPERSGRWVKLGWFLLFAAITVVIDSWWLRRAPESSFVGWIVGVRVLVAVVFTAVMGWFCLRVAFRQRAPASWDQAVDSPPTDPQQYRAEGLGPLSTEADQRDLYLDLVKRAVANILYEDPPFCFYDQNQQPLSASGFSLARRVRGEDFPRAAHTVIGIQRLDNLQRLFEDVLRNDVPGDLIETGVYRGGATIFLRALLKAHRVSDRRVFACDSFPARSPRPPWILVPILQALASIPSARWQRRFFLLLQKIKNPLVGFPKSRNPSDSLVRIVMWILRNLNLLPRDAAVPLGRVKSHFARYGLLDDQVVFLKGLFADTLPKAPIQRLAIIRLDGDTYESTRDALTLLYPKLSPGGYCIVDDFYSLADCQRAVDEFRCRHHVDEAITPIDNLAVYWQKSTADSRRHQNRAA